MRHMLEAVTRAFTRRAQAEADLRRATNDAQQAVNEARDAGCAYTDIVDAIAKALAGDHRDND